MVDDRTAIYKQHRISVHGFGPLREIVDFAIRDLVCIIGEQSAGKSTLAKLIYYCRDIRNEFIILLQSSTLTQLENVEDVLAEFNHRLQARFVSLYGGVERFKAFTVVYHYSPLHSMTMAKEAESTSLNFIFSESLQSRMENIIFEQLADLQSGAATPSIPLSIPAISELISYQPLARRAARELFYDDYHLIYVPAGRGLISRRLFVGYLSHSGHSRASYSEQEPDDGVDFLTRIYFDYVRTVRDAWERLQEDISYMDREENFHAFELRSLLNFIIKGEYKVTQGEEYITIRDGSDVPLAFTSSGQQELLWISNILQYLTFTHSKCFIIIEEPEAHLFSKGQSDLVSALAMFINITGSQLFLTTHSPYIMISLSNLLFAGTLDSAETKEAVEAIIPGIQHLQVEQAAGLLIGNGTTINILDHSIASLDVAKLDFVSEYLADIFEELLAAGRGRFSRE
ncbi:MAG: ATP-binding protein [Symbiobacteriaceae bacterium]|nr:ATP-binding protein [Symbiobacteriaceae bacterium]